MYWEPLYWLVFWGIASFDIDLRDSFDATSSGGFRKRQTAATTQATTARSPPLSWNNRAVPPAWANYFPSSSVNVASFRQDGPHNDRNDPIVTEDAPYISANSFIQPVQSTEVTDFSRIPAVFRQQPPAWNINNAQAVPTNPLYIQITPDLPLDTGRNFFGPNGQLLLRSTPSLQLDELQTSAPETTESSGDAVTAGGGFLYEIKRNERIDQAREQLHEFYEPANNAIARQLSARHNPPKMSGSTFYSVNSNGHGTNYDASASELIPYYPQSSVIADSGYFSGDVSQSDTENCGDNPRIPRTLPLRNNHLKNAGAISVPRFPPFSVFCFLLSLVAIQVYYCRFT